MSAIASAQQNGSPMLVLGGRAPAMRWGQGSLQEIDHVPFVRPLTKFAATPDATAEIPGLVDEALAAAVDRRTPARRSSTSRSTTCSWRATTRARPAELPALADGPEPDGAALERAIALLRGAERPVIMAGTNLYWGRGEERAARARRELRIPVFLNGLARGCVPADHELFFSRARGDGLKGADVALVDRRADGLPARLRRLVRRGDASSW